MQLEGTSQAYFRSSERRGLCLTDRGYKHGTPIGVKTSATLISIGVHASFNAVTNLLVDVAPVFKRTRQHWRGPVEEWDHLVQL